MKPLLKPLVILAAIGVAIFLALLAVIWAAYFLGWAGRPARDFSPLLRQLESGAISVGTESSSVLSLGKPWDTFAGGPWGEADTPYVSYFQWGDERLFLYIIDGRIYGAQGWTLGLDSQMRWYFRDEEQLRRIAEAFAHRSDEPLQANPGAAP